MIRLLRLAGTLLFSFVSGYFVVYLFSLILPITHFFDWLLVAIYFLAILLVYKIIVLCLSPILILNKLIIGKDKFCFWVSSVIYALCAMWIIYNCFVLDGLDYGFKEVLIAILNSYLVIQVFAALILPFFVK